jgi:hypothetical protein
MTAVLITQKFYSDFFYSNKFVSQVCGLKNNIEMNLLEAEFLAMVNWRVTYSLSQIEAYFGEITNYFAQPCSVLTKSIIENS